MQSSVPSRVARRRLAATGTALLLAVGLASCGDGVPPGAAAEIGEDTISVQQVDDLARVICATQAGPEAGGKAPTAAVRAVALNVLIRIAVGEGVAGDLGEVDRAAVREGVAAAAQARALVPSEDRDLFDQVVRDSTAAEIALTQAAAREVSTEGGDPNDQAALQAATARLAVDYLQEEGVEVSTRFGRLQDGQLIAGDGSLSVPVSETAKSFSGGSTDDPFGAGSQADYPASQRCA